MVTEKATYFRSLSSDNLSHYTINQILDYMKTLGLRISEVKPEIYGKGEYGSKITEQLTRLPMHLIEGNPSWEGLLIGFPGNRLDLATRSVGSPYLRMILYPILDLHHRLRENYGKRLPCIYFVGERFSGVFLRKFELLREVVPNIVVLTKDLFECAQNSSLPPITEKGIDNETWTQMILSQQMYSSEGLLIKTDIKEVCVRFLASEVPCYEGTQNPERLDILGYDSSDHALIAFEIKGPKAGRVELENLFLQGIEHRNWLEKNKMAVKLLFDRGPKGKRINTRKRVKLLLGYYGNEVPHLFYELREQSLRRDPYTEIGFVNLSQKSDKVVVRNFR